KPDLLLGERKRGFAGTAAREDGGAESRPLRLRPPFEQLASVRKRVRNLAYEIVHQRRASAGDFFRVEMSVYLVVREMLNLMPHTADVSGHRGRRWRAQLPDHLGYELVDGRTLEKERNGKGYPEAAFQIVLEPDGRQRVQSQRGH